MKSFLLVLLPFLLYAGSNNTHIDCTSASGRTLLTFDYDQSKELVKGFLSIDHKKHLYTQDAKQNIVEDLSQGVFTLNYYSKEYFLTFYALPSSIKNISQEKSTQYKFNAYITEETTDPRTHTRLNKKIQLLCKSINDWVNI